MELSHYNDKGLVDLNDKGKTILYIQDVLNQLIGEEVTIFGNCVVTGKLISYNGYLVHMYDDTEDKNYYMTIHSIEAVKTDK